MHIDAYVYAYVICVHVSNLEFGPNRNGVGVRLNDRAPSERRCLAERAPLPPPEPRAHTRGVVEVAALQCEHELALLHLLEADRARVVERLRERLPVAKLRQPMRGGALLVRVRVRARVRVKVRCRGKVGRQPVRARRCAPAVRPPEPPAPRRVSRRSAPRGARPVLCVSTWLGLEG